MKPEIYTKLPSEAQIERREVYDHLTIGIIAMLILSVVLEVANVKPF